MLALHDSKEIFEGEVNHDAMNPEDEGSLIGSEVKNMDSETNSLENKMKDREEDDAEDIDLQVSSGRRKMIILSDDEDSNPPSASVLDRPMDNEEDSGGHRKPVITDSENEDDDVMFSKEPVIPKPKVIYIFLCF